MKEVSKELAEEFAEKFFGVEGYELFCVPEFNGNNSIQNTYVYQLGNIALNILPYYGEDAFFNVGNGKRILAKNPRAEVITLCVCFTDIELYEEKLVFVDCDKAFNMKKVSIA